MTTWYNLYDKAHICHTDENNKTAESRPKPGTMSNNHDEERKRPKSKTRQRQNKDPKGPQRDRKGRASRNL